MKSIKTVNSNRKLRKNQKGNTWKLKNTFFNIPQNKDDSEIKKYNNLEKRK